MISIHTTLAGGDQVKQVKTPQTEIFQSTPPSRVATLFDVDGVNTFIISIHTTLAGGDAGFGTPPVT